MNLVEKHIIKPNNSFYKECKRLCILSKKLYNKANYIVRQEFIKTSNEKRDGLRETAVYLNYHEIRKMLIHENEYTSLPRKVSNQTLILLDKNWKSFFKAIKSYKINKASFLGRPKLPKYKDTLNGEFIVTYEKGAISRKELKKEIVHLSGTNIKISSKQKNIQQCRIIPRIGYYVIEIVYDKEEKKTLCDNKRYASIDLGLNNLATITSNVMGSKPMIINGKPLKSMNQFYNKRMSELNSCLEKRNKKKSSKQTQKLTLKRNNKINDYLHKTSRYIINQLDSKQINTLIIGKNEQWKQEINIGSKNNQNFVSVPHTTFINMLVYKCKLGGINTILQEESYTSKASFLDMDYIPTYGKIKEEPKFSGYRKHRGLYKLKGNGVVINADVNGSYNILRKAIPNAFADGIEGLSVNPLVISLI